ncbi:MAG TPA: GxxExxY protein [Anaerolineales bacterium]|nr:GxxExxY protein [Anaerolineales bacterium]HRF49492.1 GxxExxY protein [Anaerolineales bacterium]
MEAKALIHETLTYEIRGVLMEVYNTLGTGFREETYKQAVIAELRRRGIGTEREQPVPVIYKGDVVDTYRLDILVDGKVILELKAVEEFHPRHRAQVLSYLKVSGLRLGLLVNFGTHKLQIQRIIL